MDLPLAILKWKRGEGQELVKSILNFHPKTTPIPWLCNYHLMWGLSHIFWPKGNMANICFSSDQKTLVTTGNPGCFVLAKDSQFRSQKKQNSWRHGFSWALNWHRVPLLWHVLSDGHFFTNSDPQNRLGRIWPEAVSQALGLPTLLSSSKT